MATKREPSLATAIGCLGIVEYSVIYQLYNRMFTLEENNPFQMNRFERSNPFI